MFGDKFNLGNIASLMKNAGKIQDMLKEGQEKLAKTEVTGEAGAGAVKVTVNAQNYVKKIDIDDETFNEGKAIVEELVTAAINDATAKVEKIKEEMMSSSDIFGDIIGGKE